MNGRRAIYPGSFDPITNGHLDILRRALTIVDHVVIAVAYNENKRSGLFTAQERIAMIKEVTHEFGARVTADSFYGLLVEYARNAGAGTIIRGLRAVADFDYEFQMTTMNRHLAPDVETVYLMADQRHFYTSSSLVKEVVGLGGDVSGHVPKLVAERLKQKLGR
jgi:pantetheine-phosphate adenylyltransferase